MNVHEYLESVRGRPFEWGSHDCATFSIRWIRSQREDLVDVCDELLSKEYVDERSACDAYRTTGTVQAAVKHMSTFFVGVRPGLVRTGDVCVVEQSDGTFPMGIVVNTSVAIVSPDGLVFVGQDTIRLAWRV